MSQQHLIESPEIAKQQIASREVTAETARAVHDGPPSPILQLHRTLGNHRVAQLIQAKRLTPQGKILGLQRKLTVGAADDQYEQEADRVARHVVSMPDAVAAKSLQRTTSPEEDKNQEIRTRSLAASIMPFVQRQMGKDNEEEKDKPIQAKAAASVGGSFNAGAEVESRLSHSKGGGSPLPDPVRAFMEPRFGVDFSHVRIHTDNSAIQMNRDIAAQAFTHGADIYYGAGSSPTNLDLTAHELTHVVQQTGGALPQAAPAVQHQEAKDAGEKDGSGHTFSISHTGVTNDYHTRKIGTEGPTTGSNSHSASGNHSPGTTKGSAVLGHARAHLASQGQGMVSKIIAQKKTVGTTKHLTPKPLTRLQPAKGPGPRKTPSPAVSKIPAQKVHPRPTLPSRAQEQHRSAVADGKGSIAALPELTMPVAKSVSGKILLDTLQKGANTGRENLAAAAEASIQSTTAIAEQQAATVNVAESASVQAVQTHVQHAREHVFTTVEQHSSSVLQAQGTEQERLVVWHTQATIRAHEDVSNRQQTIIAKGTEHASKIRASGEHTAEAASSDFSSAATQSRSQTGGGGGEAGEGGAEVANRLGSDTARQFDSASTDVGRRLRTHAGEAAAELESHTSHAAASIGTHLTTLQGQLHQTMEGADSALADLCHQSVATLQRGGERTQSELETGEAQVIDSVHVRSGEQRDQIYTASAEAATGMRSLAQKSVKAAQQQLAAHAERIVTAHIDEKTAADIAPTLHSEVVNAYSTAAADARQTETQVAGHLSAVGHETAASLGHVAPTTAVNLATASQTIASKIGVASDYAGAAMRRSISTVTTGGDEGIIKSIVQLDQVVGTAQSGYAEVEAAAGRSLDQHASETSRFKTEALTGLHGRIAEGQQRVDSYVAAKGPVVQRSVLGSIGNWVAEQFKDLWNMLSSPAFWVGLVVTIVLFPALGPGALVVGGLAAGIASGIEQNVKQGRSWYDHHNIIRSAFIGALGGAVMAFGLGVILGLGLEGAAAVAAGMALSAVIGIVINFVNGERWDKGLLANLLLAWLFMRIFGGRAPEGEVPPETKPPVVDPNAPPKPEPPKVEPPQADPDRPPPVARTPEQIGKAIREEARSLPGGKKATIARRVTEAGLSQEDAVTATRVASEVFGRVGATETLPDGSKVVPSVQAAPPPGAPNQPIFVVRPDGSVFPARATLTVQMSPTPHVEVTNVVPE